MKILFVLFAIVSFCAPQIQQHAGIKVRLDQSSLNTAKDVSQLYLPDIINFDLQMPQKFTKYMFKKQVKFQWRNITYDKVDLNMKDIQINLQGNDTIFIDFPALK